MSLHELAVRRSRARLQAAKDHLELRKAEKVISKAFPGTVVLSSTPQLGRGVKAGKEASPENVGVCGSCECWFSSIYWLCPECSEPRSHVISGKELSGRGQVRWFRLRPAKVRV